MAIAERHLAAEFGDDVVDHRTYVLASDGDLMEGISQEAIALAGHLKLNRLIVLFDDNGISIDGPLSLADSVDQVKRFEAAGWAASRIDGHDPDAIAAAIEQAQDLRPADPDRLPHHHRLRRADQGRQREVRTARRSAPTRSRARARSSAGREPPFEIPADVLDAVARRRPALARPRARTGTSGSQRCRPTSAPSSSAACAATCRATLDAAVRAVKEKLADEPKEIATRKASEIALESLIAGGAGDDRRLGRPHRLQQHHAPRR